VERDQGGGERRAERAREPARDAVQQRERDQEQREIRDVERPG